MFTLFRLDVFLSFSDNSHNKFKFNIFKPFYNSKSDAVFTISILLSCQVHDI